MRTGTRWSRNLSGARNQLKHHLTRGSIKAVARGLYAAVPPGLDAKRFHPDPFLVAVAARPNGIFSYHSALELLGAAHSVWGECTMHCDRRRGPIEVGTTRILFLPTPDPIRRHDLQKLGTRPVSHRVRKLMATGTERTLVEGIRQPHRVGGLEELLEAISGVRSLDFNLLQQVLEGYGERKLWAAVGWLAERHREEWSTPDKFLEVCRAHNPKQSQYLVRGLRGGRLVRGWRLIVPETLLKGPEGHASDS
jgi:predicted transcriptional regulator of viral defense system